MYSRHIVARLARPIRKASDNFEAGFVKEKVNTPRHFPCLAACACTGKPVSLLTNLWKGCSFPLWSLPLPDGELKGCRTVYSKVKWGFVRLAHTRLHICPPELDTSPELDASRTELFLWIFALSNRHFIYSPGWTTTILATSARLPLLRRSSTTPH